jgi:hypothetical protein
MTATMVPRGALLTVAIVGLALPGTGSAAALPSPSRDLRAAAAPERELRPAQRITLPGGTVVKRYQQRVVGAPVLGAQAVTQRAPGAPAQLAADTTRARIEVPSSSQLSRERAVAIARASVGSLRLRGPITAKLAIQPGHGGRLVWRILIPAAHPLGDFEVLVDAGSGEVVARNDLLRRFRTGAAMLYKVNPVVQHGGASRLWSDRHDHDTRLLQHLRRRVRLSNLESGQHCLRGRWVHALRGHRERETCKPDLHWMKTTRSDNRFEALMVYFQINRSQQYVQSLGFSDSNSSPNGIADHVQRAVADAYRQDNSFYSPVTHTVTFGLGGVDDAEDGDVILHEYAHAMQDSESRAFGRSLAFQPAALAEGSSDYWAAAMSSLTPKTSNEDDVCIFDWDATSYGKFFPKVPSETSGRHCGRRADVTRTFDQAKSRCRRVPFGGRFVPDPHCVGEVWSSALWSMRRRFVARAHAKGGARMDRVYLASQFLYTAKESFKDAGNALLCADEDLRPHGTPGDCHGRDYSLIHRELHRRGILG